jgi:hypothetical protein
MGIRRSVKEAIKTTILRTNGITSVMTFRPKVKQTNFPLVVVSLSKSRETSASAPRPLGKRNTKYLATVQILHYDYSGDGSGQLDFDDMLDAIDAQLRDDPQLGGVALASAVEYIETIVAPPQLDQQALVLAAVKQFDVTVQETG